MGPQFPPAREWAGVVEFLARHVGFFLFSGSQEFWDVIGKIVKVDAAFGFIDCLDLKQHVFFHKSHLPRGTELSGTMVSRKVEFELGEDNGKGPRAVSVKLLEE